MDDWQCVWPARAVLGEGPLWSATENALYWVDILAPALHRYGLDGSRTSWPMPEKIGWVIERTGGGFIAGLGSGFAELTLEPFAIRPIGRPWTEGLPLRMNDAVADREGRIWAGAMDENERDKIGALWRLDIDRRWTCVDEGYIVANGPAISPDGKTLYHTDSPRRRVYRFDLLPDGTLANRRVFVAFDEAWGYPDGMTVDAMGCVWIAHWDGGRVSRFSPAGERTGSIRLPVSRVTSCIFAGASLDRLFVTSASMGVESEPLAGALFEIDPGATGLPTHRFGG